MQWLAVQVRLKHSKEVVCLAMTDSLVAVGSQSHISLIDARKKSPVQEVESLDHSHGMQRRPARLAITAARAHVERLAAILVQGYTRARVDP